MIICIKHPKYKGKNPPQLSCRPCCRTFLEEVKRKHQHNEDSSDGIDLDSAHPYENSALFTNTTKATKSAKPPKGGRSVKFFQR